MRLRFRFRIRTLLVFIFIGAMTLGYYSRRWNQLKDEANVLTTLQEREVLESYDTRDIQLLTAEDHWLTRAIDFPIQWFADRYEKQACYSLWLKKSPSKEDFAFLKRLRYLEELEIDVDDVDQYADFLLTLPSLKRIYCCNRLVSSSSIKKWEAHGIQVVHIGMTDYSLAENYIRLEGYDYPIDQKSSWVDVTVDQARETVMVDLHISANQQYCEPEYRETSMANTWNKTPVFTSSQFIRKMPISDWQTNKSIIFERPNHTHSTFERTTGIHKVDVETFHLTPLDKQAVWIKQDGEFEINAEVKVGDIIVNGAPTVESAIVTLKDFFDLELNPAAPNARDIYGKLRFGDL